VIRFPSIPDGDPLFVSATLYRTYLQCPEQALGRLQGMYAPESIPGFRGSLAHRLFARHLTDGPIPPGDVQQACREEIGAGLNPKLGALGLNKPSTLAPIIAEVGDLYTRFRRFPSEGFRAAEIAIEHDVGGSVTLRGKVDAVFDDPDWGVRIVDWKTGSFLDDAGDQLDFYAMAWAVDTDELPGRVEAISVPTGERVGIEPSENGVASTCERVVGMVTELRAAFESGDELERRAGPGCRFCPLLEGCGEGAAAVAIAGA
jgi:hypothetical protein